MDMEFVKKHLGYKVKDVVSNIEGICSSVLLQANGNVMLGIQPTAKDNAYVEPMFHDVNIIDILDAGVSERVPDVSSPVFCIGDTVRDKISDFQGTISSIQWFVSGCEQYAVVGKKLNTQTSKPALESFLSERLEKIGTNKKVAETPAKKTGGPSMKVHRAF